MNFNNSKKGRPTPEIFISVVESYVLSKALASGARRVAPFLSEGPVKSDILQKWPFSRRAHV